MKRIFEDIEFDSLSSRKHLHLHVTCFLDLPDEILVGICRYLSSYDVLYSFYTPENPELRFHNVINDYYKKIKLNGITNNQFNYFYKLFCNLKTPLRLKSLILNNEQIYHLIQRYSDQIDINIIKSIFDNLISFTLIDCFSRDLYLFDYYYINLTQLKYLHITICYFNENIFESHHPLCKLSYSQFTLLESRISLIIDDIICIFGYMPNLIKLILSICDTFDTRFCQGSIFESILTEYLPNLQIFDYTITHRINDKTLIEDFNK